MIPRYCEGYFETQLAELQQPCDLVTINLTYQNFPRR